MPKQHPRLCEKLVRLGRALLIQNLLSLMESERHTAWQGLYAQHLYALLRPTNSVHKRP